MNDPRRWEDAGTVLPDYLGGGIVNLTASLVTALGGEEDLYPPLAQLDPELLRRATAVVLIVVDGMGYTFLRRRRRQDGLLRHLRGAMTSVFPSTTATAITTFLTGMAPQQHGLTGWYMYLPEIDGISAVLPFTWRGGDSLRKSGFEAAPLVGHRSLYERLAVPSYVIIPKNIANSDFNRSHGGAVQTLAYGSMTQFVRSIHRAVAMDGARKFVYAYWPELDALAHDHGIGSAAAGVHYERLELALEGLLRELQGRGVTVIITADHGMLDTGPAQVIELSEHPDLARMLLRPLCGERRAAYCYLRPGSAGEFCDYVQQRLADYMTLLPSAEVLRRGYFGLGPPHPSLHERIGDFVMLMKQNFVIKDWVAGEKRHVHLGVHGGMSPEEMLVPLILAHD